MIPKPEFISLDYAEKLLQCNREDIYHLIFENYLPVYVVSPPELSSFWGMKHQTMCRCKPPFKWTAEDGENLITFLYLTATSDTGEELDFPPPFENVDIDGTPTTRWTFHESSFSVRRSDIEKLLSGNEKDAPTPDPVKITPQTQTAAYSFRCEEAFWRVTFAGQESKPIPHVEGLKYIHFLIQHPQKSFSCLSLYQIVNGAPVEGNGDAMSEGLYSDHTRQEVLTPEARKKYQIRLVMLENADDTGNPESDRIRREEIEEIRHALGERSFPDDLKKKQILVDLNINKAYEKILTDPAMKNAIKHFHDNIKTDGKMGLTYTGDLACLRVPSSCLI